MRGSIIQQKGSPNWTVILDVGKDVSGKRKQKWITVKGSKRAAEKKLAELLNEVEKGTFVNPDKMTVSSYLEQWLTGHVKSTTSPRTHELYSYITHKHLVPTLGNILLCNLHPQQIQSLYAEKLQQGLSPRTVQLCHTTLSNALANAVRTGLMARSPIIAVDPPKVERHEMRTMTEDDVTRFLNEARKGEYYSLFFTLLFTGLRRGEALSLIWNDIDIQGSQLSVNRTMQFVNNTVTFKAPKTNASRRQIAISPNTGIVLRLHRKAQDKVRQSLNLPPVKDSDLVFCHYDGKPYLPRSVTHAWTKLTRRCGLDGINLHSARHTHASLMLKSGISPKVIQERLGHSTFGMTMNLYAHVSPGMQKEAVSRFDTMIMGVPEKVC